MKKQKIILITVISLFGFYLAGSTITALVVYSGSFGKVDGFQNDSFYTYITWNEVNQVRYSREEVYFNSGGNKLQGFIYGRENSNGLVVISQGLGGLADSYFPMIMYFVDNGWRVFAFNNTGVDGSEGRNTRGLIQSVIDLDAALTYIEASGKFIGLPVMLVGHSWGGYAVCAVLNYDHNVNAVVSFAGFNKGSEVIRKFGVSMAGGFYYLVSPQLWLIEKIRFGNTAQLTAVDGINKAGIPVMIVQSSDDDSITPDDISIYAHRSKITNPNAEIVFFDGANASGHEYVFCSGEQREYMRLAISSWQEYRTGHQSITNSTLAQWAREYNFDKIKANELNPDLMERINTFFVNASY